MIMVFVLVDIPVWTKAYAFFGVADPFGHALSCAAVLITICVGLDLIKRHLAEDSQGTQGRTKAHVNPVKLSNDSKSSDLLHTGRNVKAGRDEKED